MEAENKENSEFGSKDFSGPETPLLTKLRQNLSVIKTPESFSKPTMFSERFGPKSSPIYAEGLGAMRNRVDSMELRLESRLDRMEAMLERFMQTVMDSNRKIPSNDVMNQLGRAENQIFMQEDASVKGKLNMDTVNNSPVRLEENKNVLAGVMPQEAIGTSMDSDNRLYIPPNVNEHVGEVTESKLKSSDHVKNESNVTDSYTRPRMPMKGPGEVLIFLGIFKSNKLVLYSV